MNIWELVLVAFGALRINLMRSILTMLGIIIGVAAVITMVTVGAGAQLKIDEQISSLGSNLLMILPGSRSRGGVSLAAGTNVSLTENDAKALKKEIPEIVAAAPSIRGSVQIIFGNSNWSTTVQGVDLDYLVARNWVIAEGRNFTSREIRGNAKVVLIGRTVSRELFGESAAIDQTVRLKNVPFKVIGVLQEKGQSMSGQDQDDLIMVPLGTARTKLLGRNAAEAKAVSVIMVSVRDGTYMPDIEERVDDVLMQRHRIPVGQDTPFRIRNLSEMVETRAAAAQVFSMLLAAVASVSLLVGGIGIMNIMLVSVTERTREIGLRMAVGATPRNILNQFLVEAVALCLIGGVLGILLAIAAAVIISNMAGWPILIQWHVILLSCLFSAVIGVFFGYYPAKKAADQNPIEALRYE